MIGKTVSSYDVLAKAGEGGMGVVYLARDRRLGREVALKFLFPDMLRSNEARARFEREARLVSSVSHPNIATLFACGDSPEGTYLVFEYLPGGTLSDRMPRRGRELPPVSVHQGLEWAVQIAGGLAYAHRKGIVHRDVKPANVLFDSEGRAKLSDFGLAKADQDSSVTQAGVTVGTATYMAPEQAIGADANASSDLYSFGVLLYELFTGQRPFPTDDPRGTFFHILESAPAEPRTLRPDLPDALNRLILRAIEKKPVNRPASMEEVLEELKRIQTLSDAATNSDTATFVLRTASEMTFAAGGAGTPKTLGQQRRWILIAVVVFVLLVTIAIGTFRGNLQGLFTGVTLPDERKLAVLLFENLDGGTEHQAFCDGLTDALTSAITNIGQTDHSLWVVPASEIRAENVRSIREARRLFGVNLAITGSLRRPKDNVRVILNLVDAEHAKQLDSKTIELPAAGLPALETKLSQTVATMLQARTFPATGGGSVSPAVTASAYEFYLQGRGFLQRFDLSENLGKAITAFEAALQREPNYPLAIAGLGEAYLAQHSLTQDPQWLAKAQSATERAIQLDPRLAESHVNLCTLYTRTSRFDSAIDEGRKARDLDPLNADAYRALAQAYSRAGRDEEAERTYRQAIDLRPGFWLPYKDLGVHYLNLGKFPEAEQMFRDVIEKTPDNEWGYRNLATVFHFTGRFRDAEDQLRNAVSRKPTGEAYSNLGTIYYVQERFEEAKNAYIKATELNPSDPIVWGNLGDALRAMPSERSQSAQVYRKAIDLGERQLSINAKDSQLLLGLALYSAKLGDHRRAGEFLSRAGEIVSGRATLHYQASIIQELAGKRTESLHSLQLAIANGYPIDEVEKEPELAALRSDHRYQRILSERPVR